MLAMIESLNISGFRAAQDVSLSDLGKVNLFIGPNGSGKSTMLEAAFLYCVEGDTSKLIDIMKPESIEYDADSMKRALLWLFTHISEAEHRKITVSGTVDGVSRNVCVKPVEADSDYTQMSPSDLGRSSAKSAAHNTELENFSNARRTAILDLELAITHGDDSFDRHLIVSRDHGVYYQGSQQSQRLLATFTHAMRPYFVDSKLPKLVSDARLAGTLPEVEETLRTVDPAVIHLEINLAANGTGVVYVKHDRLGLCPLGILGDGLSNVLHFALRVTSGGARYVMYDEFDANFHVSVIRSLAQVIKKVGDDGTQLFLTTHRADTLSTFVDLVEDGWDGLTVYQTRLENGEVKVQSFAGERLLSVWCDLALDIRVPS